MKIFLTGFICILVFNSFATAQKCPAEPDTVPPVISEAAKKVYVEKLGEAVKQYHDNPDNPDGVIWFGRRQAYLGWYKQALKTYNGAAVRFPNDARIYRHRGHRYITIRCFDDAIKDFKKAAELVKGKPDEIEPDGLPNARNIPTSTLQSNIWYHLGLAYYLKGNFKKALNAYKECMKVSKNPDMQVATAHWLYMTLRRLGKEKEAREAVADIADNLDIIENDDYYKLIKLYQGKTKAEDMLGALGATGAAANSLGNASLGYGLGNWFLYNGKKTEAENVFKQITNGDQWASFGFIAAEVELKTMPK